jgi:hypothetical protein
VRLSKLLQLLLLLLLLMHAEDDWIRIRNDSGTGESRVPGNWEVSEVARISTRMKEFSDQTCLKKANATLMAAAADDDDHPSTSTVCSTWVHATFESKSQSNSHHSLLLVELVLCALRRALEAANLY